MTKIALVGGTYQPQQCGVAHYTAHLREHLLKHGVRSIVLTTVAAAEVAADPTVYGVIQQWQIRELWKLVQAIGAEAVDLLHIQHAAGTYRFDRSIFLLPLLLRSRGWHKPIVTTVHEYGWWEWQPPLIPGQWLEALKIWGQQRGWWDREDGFLLTLSDAIITTNPQATEIIQSRLPFLHQRMHQIPIAANVGVFEGDRAIARQHVLRICGWQEENQLIAFFGFLHPVKGLEILLKAFQEVLQTHPQVRLLLVGGVESLALPDEQASAYWDKLTQLIEALCLTEKVHRTDYLEPSKVSLYLSSANIGVLPFHHGVTLKSGSLLTLFAHSLPVIATRSAEPQPDLEERNLARFIPPRDLSGLVTELRMLLDNPLLQKQLSQAGHTYSQTFSWPKITEQHLQIYQQLLASQPAFARTREVLP